MNQPPLWFYELAGTQQGPVAATAIREMVVSGVLARQSLVWREGLGGWVPFEKSELNVLAPSLPPVLGMLISFTPRIPRLNPDFSFSVFRSLGDGWRTMLGDFWLFVGFYALASVILSLASNLLIPIFFLTFPLLGGYMYYTLKRIRGNSGNIEDIFDGFKRRFGSLVVLSFIASIPFVLVIIAIFATAIWSEINPGAIESNLPLAIALLGGGFVLLLTAATIIACLCWMASLLCMDCDITWSKAFGLAVKAYGKRFFRLTAFFLISCFLANIGVLVFFVGFFVTGAWMVIAFSHVYEKAFGDSPNPAT